MSFLKPSAPGIVEPNEYGDRFPVSALQYGMLLHSLSAPEHGCYLQQKIVTLCESLNVAAFEDALIDLSRRHPVLRSTFEVGPEWAVQVVQRDARIAVEQHDWRELTFDAQRANLQDFLTSDRRRPFDFAGGAPMRFALFRLAEAHYEFVWSSHHALMDGRSYLTLLSELFDTYDAAVVGGSVTFAMRPPFSDYIRWLGELDDANASAFWRERLSGVTSTTLLPADAVATPTADAEVFAAHTIELGEGLAAALRRVADERGLTVNSLTQAAWTLLLSRASGCDNVVFGTTKSCRAAAPGGADIVGLCINTVPFAARIGAASTVSELASQLRQQQLTLRGFEQWSLAQIRECCAIPPGDPFFETVIVFEDFLLDRRLRARGGAWTNRSFRIEERSHYPLTLSAYLDDRLTLRLGYDRRRFLDTTGERILSYLAAVLETIATTPDAPVRDILRIAEYCELPPTGLKAAAVLGFINEADPPAIERDASPTKDEDDEAEWTVRLPPGIAGGDESLLALLLAFVARLSGEEAGHVDLRWPPAHHGYVPFRVPRLGPTCGIDELCADVGRTLGQRPHNFAGRGLPIAIERVAGSHGRVGLRPGTRLQVEILEGRSECRFRPATTGEREATSTISTRFRAFLSAAAAPAIDVTRLPVLSDEDRARIRNWNDTACEYPHDRCVHQLVTAQARRRPEAPAVAFDGRSLTYGELERQSSSLAVWLARTGVGRGSRVGVYLSRSERLITCLLAVMKSGAAYVPMDTTYPRERLTYMAVDSGVSVLLTESALRDHLPESDAAVVVIDEHWDAIVAARDEPCEGSAPEDVAYVIYTSGSTGSPKGVAVGHRALTNLLCAMAGRPGFTENDTLLAVTTVCFDIAALELLLPLVCGGAVELVSAVTARDPVALAARIAQSRPTVMQATPTTWKMLRVAGWSGDSNLRIFCGGEALAADLASELVPIAKEVWNLYGPTETTIWSSAARVESNRPVTIGRPIANTQFYVVDGRRELTPPGVAGELYIAGTGVALGYINRPALTQERFVPCPFGDSPGMMYRTGDVVRFLPDGNVTYVGRVDRQVKLLGYRIELGEVECTLRSHPSVRDAAAIVREDLDGDRRLIAYVVPNDSSSGTLRDADLREHLKSALPGYMIPSAFALLERLPLTLNGKVDYNALPHVAVPSVSGPPPADDLEQRLASIWCSVLGQEQIGLDDNFFEVGGNSLRALQVVARLRDSVSQSLGPGDLFVRPTIRAMAGYVSGRLAAEPRANSGWRNRRLEERNAVLDDLRRTRLDVTRRRDRMAPPSRSAGDHTSRPDSSRTPES
jgi:amino acid adenylation domain-containing protein